MTEGLKKLPSTFFLSNPSASFLRKGRKKGLQILPLYGINQASKGIRQWPIDLCTSQMMMHKITPYITFGH